MNVFQKLLVTMWRAHLRRKITNLEQRIKYHHMEIEGCLYLIAEDELEKEQLQRTLSLSVCPQLTTPFGYDLAKH